VGGRLQVRLGPCDLNSAIQDAIEAVGPSVNGAQHTLTVDLPDEPVIVVGDRDRITQVVSNLLNNAVKYTPRKGRIGLTVRESDDSAELVVTDNGIGIEPEMTARIFEMFLQLPNAADGSRSGLGIGLTLVKSIVDMHGGTVSVESGPEKGSRFVVRLPLSQEKPRRKPPAARARKAPARILIADDQVDAAQILGMVIERAEHEVRVVGSGEEALKIGAKFEPDVVLLDLGMPTMDGYEAARRIRAARWGKDATLIAVTGWGSDDDRRHSREAGFDHHVVKPSDLTELLAIIARAPRRKP
jgi:CheY-like chemotaxis protein